MLMCEKVKASHHRIIVTPEHACASQHELELPVSAAAAAVARGATAHTNATHRLMC
jgi:hypothetical protein